MTELTSFGFPGTGQTVRVLQVNDEPWFVAADVCTVLGIGNPSQAVSYLDEDERAETLISNEGSPGNPRKTIVSEPGLYSLILRSRKPEAKAFKRWVVHEVLPAIRRTGSYAAARELTRADLARMVLEEADRADVAEERAATLAPAAEAWDALAQATGDYSVREAAQILDRDPNISTGQNRLFARMREIGWIDGKGEPYQAQVDAGRLVRRTTSYTHPHSREPVLSSQVRITLKGLKELRRRLAGQQLMVVEGST